MKLKYLGISSAVMFILAAMAGVFGFVSSAIACTMEMPSPEIEIEIEWEDYDDILNLLIYKVQIEVEVQTPSQTAQCQCGIGVGSNTFPVPASFQVLAAAVGVKNDDADTDDDLPFFEGFSEDQAVTAALTALPGFNPGATGFGLSTSVDPFQLPPLIPGDRLVLGFLIVFAPEDFYDVNGKPIQFAAGSTEPGHPLALFTNQRYTLNLPPFQLDACDTDFDQDCDIDDLNGILALGPINVGVPRTDATEVYDLIGDDVINLQDAQEWLTVAATVNGLSAPYKFGDANLDGAVNGVDFLFWWFNRGSLSLFWSDGNFSGDGVVNYWDFLIWRANRDVVE